MIKDLRDSEQKLIVILDQINAHEAAENKETQVKTFIDIVMFA